jgi:uncharacterized protein (TIGR00369 family)
MNPFETIKAHLSRAVPYATHTGVTIDEVGDGVARASLPMRPEVSNHIGTVHAGAMFTLAEAASGAALAGTFAENLLSLRPVAAEASIRYLKVAKGSLTADARVDGDADTVRATLEAEGKVAFPITVTLIDDAGVTVATVTVSWHVSPLRT